MGEAVIHQILNKITQPIGWVILFRSLAPLRANALEPAARKARVVHFGTKPNCWLCLSRAHPTLSWGTPCDRNHQPINEKRAALTRDPFSHLEAWR